jgi:hypothetical protein
MLALRRIVQPIVRLQPPHIQRSARSWRCPLVPENQEHANDHAPENAGQRGYTESGELQHEGAQEQDDREHCPDSSPNGNLVNTDLYAPILVGHLMNAAEKSNLLPLGHERRISNLTRTPQMVSAMVVIYRDGKAVWVHPDESGIS